MTTFIASDLHLNHLSILKCCPHRWVDYDGFAPPDLGSVSVMNETIINNWNSVVHSDDEVYILGDVAMGHIHLAPALIRRLNGKKYLIKGNHDKTLHKLILNGSGEFDDLFMWVKDVHSFTYKYDDKKVQLFMSHFPHAHWPTNHLHFHGHLHSPPDRIHLSAGKIMDVGIDGNNLFPRTLDSAISAIIDRPEQEHHY